MLCRRHYIVSSSVYQLTLLHIIAMAVSNMSFSDLPAEIVAHICACTHCTSGDLATLCRIGFTKCTRSFLHATTTGAFQPAPATTSGEIPTAAALQRTVGHGRGACQLRPVDAHCAWKGQLTTNNLGVSE